MILPPAGPSRKSARRSPELLGEPFDLVPIDAAIGDYVVHQVPLATAVLGMFQFVLQPDFVNELFDRFRGRAYEGSLTFAELVEIVGAAITRDTTIHKALKRAEATLPVTTRAVYGKLSRLPLGVSLELLQEGTRRLRELLPASYDHGVPECFAPLRVLIVDGKKSKNVAKRLKACRDQPGRVFGAKLLVCLEARTRLVLAASGDADGERNDNPLVPDLLERVRSELPHLYVCDAQFCDLVQVRNMVGEGSFFAFRHHPKTHFHADPKRPARTFVDGKGRTLVEEWGELGSAKDPRRCAVRRVTWRRASALHKDLSVVSNLTDAAAYPAEAMIDLYLMRWKIETVFQEVATVFGLQHLIGSTPEASAFETSLCMLMYNGLQVVKTQLAREQGIPVDDVSSHNLFGDVREEMTALYQMLRPEEIAARIETPTSAPEMRAWLESHLKGRWQTTWRKARNKTKRTYTPKPKQSGAHTSIDRLRRKHKISGP